MSAATLLFFGYHERRLEREVRRRDVNTPEGLIWVRSRIVKRRMAIYRLTVNILSRV